MSLTEHIPLPERGTVLCIDYESKSRHFVLRAAYPFHDPSFRLIETYVTAKEAHQARDELTKRMAVYNALTS